MFCGLCLKTDSDGLLSKNPKPGSYLTYLKAIYNIINMTNTVGKHISIKDYQERYVNENHINLSSLVQEKLDEEIPGECKQRLRDKDNKSRKESE